MSKRSIECCLLGGLAIVCLAAAGCHRGSRPGDSVPEGAAPAAQARLITVVDAFGPLERPPVPFDHDKHTRALKSEGCEICHPTDDHGDVRFTFSAVKDQTGRNALMNAYHDDCIGCHTRRTHEGEKAGPVTCGECHVVERLPHEYEYLPVMPDYYEVLRDTYHSDCITCHREPGKVTEVAGTLDWKRFYVKQRTTEDRLPKVSFDYLWHDKHDKALAGKCELCHSLSPEKQAELKAKGQEPAGQDWVWDVEESDRFRERQTAHDRCINCHLRRRAEAAATAGPLECGECHSGAQRTIEELAGVVRPKSDAKDLMLMRLDEGARANAVAFDHKSHVAKSHSCQECHHKTLRPCADCHTVEGSEKGGGITLAEAHHKVSSPLSCVGCHEAEKSKPDCAGCHQFLPRGLVQDGCSGCHSGSLERLTKPGKLPPPESLIAEKVHDKIEISRIEELYQPAAMPHLAMARKLTEISNRSTLASYFHTGLHAGQMTVCAGCHHLGPLEAKASLPSCATCHTARREPGSGTPTLLGAYHQRCLGCHYRMDPSGRAMPQTCSGCHEEKGGQSPFAGTARDQPPVGARLRTNGDCPLFPAQTHLAAQQSE